MPVRQWGSETKKRRQQVKDGGGGSGAEARLGVEERVGDGDKGVAEIIVEVFGAPPLVGFVVVVYGTDIENAVNASV